MATDDDTFARKFWACVEKTPESCWLWIGPVYGPSGHGVWLDRYGYLIGAHKLSWELYNGREVPDTEPKVIVCHKCDLPICVAPRHLYLGTYQQNARDREFKGRREMFALEFPRYHAKTVDKTEWVSDCIQQAISRKEIVLDNTNRHDGK